MEGDDRRLAARTRALSRASGGGGRDGTPAAHTRPRRNRRHLVGPCTGGGVSSTTERAARDASSRATIARRFDAYLSRGNHTPTATERVRPFSRGNRAAAPTTQLLAHHRHGARQTFSRGNRAATPTTQPHAHRHGARQTFLAATGRPPPTAQPHAHHRHGARVRPPPPVRGRASSRRRGGRMAGREDALERVRYRRRRTISRSRAHYSLVEGDVRPL